MNIAAFNLIFVTFFLSGCAALIYQLVWQRYLFTGLGVDIDSVTLIVSSFMLGIGIGGSVGGWLADRFPRKRLVIYAYAELLLSIFGAFSPLIFGGFQILGALGWPYAMVSGAAILLVLLPTVIMGSTLPLLTVYFDDAFENIGVSVGKLYFSNTLGAALGAWLSAWVLFPMWGLNNSAKIAASINILCFVCVLVAARLDVNSFETRKTIGGRG
ncbi:hypothetical protein H9K76_21530 [Diaphorobacter ruginosibacter]|uniref:Major facilitator superfamily (MFS) profile domain-containing protein n=1 Tax=Diaphorobacter ruginosibacter TaxID=1715720 RepID=A0A7G9RN56_9BURK|nr:hypothetical protein [Diaphorobacter ruginosibacter]QNN57031.1 hypothetical protein H9K76_21530 [Diaphorobacter ruginosibacter]